MVDSAADVGTDPGSGAVIAVKARRCQVQLAVEVDRDAPRVSGPRYEALASARAWTGPAHGLAERAPPAGTRAGGSLFDSPELLAIKGVY